jgi:hypothetical protein
MGTVHHLSIDDGPRLRDWRDDPTDALELPGWEEFTSARDRFFANLRAASEHYRNGQAAGGANGGGNAD